MKERICTALVGLTLLGMPLLTQAKKIELILPDSRDQLPARMETLLENIFTLELMSTGTKPLNYVEMQENAAKMLAVIQKIRQNDKTGKFKHPLKDLELDVQRLRDAAAKQDERALGYVDKIYDSCFECHRQHRQQPRF